MKTIRTLTLILAMCFALASCGAKPAAAPNSSASAEGSASLTEIANPVQEVTAEEQVEMTGIVLTAPEGAEGLTYLVIDGGEDAPIAQLDFLLNGQAYTYRGQAKDGGEPETLAGMYCDWTQTIEDAEVGYCTAAIYVAEGEEKAECIIWNDVVPGISYSISALDTVDTEVLLSIANETFVPMQGEAEGAEVADEACDADDIIPSATAFTSYDEVVHAVIEAMEAGSGTDAYREMGISYLYGYPNDPEAPFGYAYVDLNGDGSDEMVMGIGGEYGFMVDGFAMQDGKLVHLFDGGERDRYYLCEGNVLHEEGSGSAMNSFDVYYTYDGTILQAQEGVFYDEEQDAENPWTHMIYENNEGAAETITDDEAVEILNGYTGVAVEMTPFVK